MRAAARAGMLAISLTLLLITAARGDEVLFEQARKKIGEQLRDPYSAKFEDLKLVQGSNQRGEPYRYVCGNLNAKNSFGGYIGRKPFYFDLTSSAFYMIEQVQPPDLAASRARERNHATTERQLKEAISQLEAEIIQDFVVLACGDQLESLGELREKYQQLARERGALANDAKREAARANDAKREWGGRLVPVPLPLSKPLDFRGGD